MKKLLASLIVLITLLGCVANPSPSTPNEPDPQLEVITLTQLAQFDGRDGRPAYVAVDGIVYDVSDVPEWANGHQGLAAGADHSEAIGRSPHGKSVLRNLPVVGRLE